MITPEMYQIKSVKQETEDVFTLAVSTQRNEVPSFFAGPI